MSNTSATSIKLPLVLANRMSAYPTSSDHSVYFFFDCSIPPISHNIFSIDKKHIGILESLKTLKSNWDGYGSDKPTENTVDSARTFLEAMHSLENAISPSLISPSTEGGVGISFSFGNRKALIEFYNDGENLLALIPENGNTRFLPVQNSRQDFTKALEAINDFLNSSGIAGKLGSQGKTSGSDFPAGGRIVLQGFET